jgi:S1-C subfamily serine protease
MKRGHILLISCLLLTLGMPVYSAREPEDIFKAIVKIRSHVPTEARTASTLGTEREGYGVVIDSKGDILTIGYLIVEAETIEVIGPRSEPVKAEFVGYDHETGFGLLRAEEPLGIEPLKLGSSATLKAGDPILVLGQGGPKNAGGAYVVRRMEFAAPWEYLLEDAIVTYPAYPDYGGAALIGPEGRLLGIGSLLTSVSVPQIGSVSCNIFVPIDLLTPILRDLMAGRPRKAPRPWLGINSEEAHGRVFVTQVTAGGPGEKAGLEKDDLIMTVKGEPVSGLADFYRKVWALGDAGVEVIMTVLRGARMHEIKVRSTDRNQFLQLKPKRTI